MNSVLENSVFALGGSILLLELRQRQKSQQFQYSSHYRIDKEPALDICKQVKIIWKRENPASLMASRRLYLTQ